MTQPNTEWDERERGNEIKAKLKTNIINFFFLFPSTQFYSFIRRERERRKSTVQIVGASSSSSSSSSWIHGRHYFRLRVRKKNNNSNSERRRGCAVSARRTTTTTTHSNWVSQSSASISDIRGRLLGRSSGKKRELVNSQRRRKYIRRAGIIMTNI